MYVKCLILILCLSVCTTCDMLIKPLDIFYRSVDELNMVVFVNRISNSVSSYRIKRYSYRGMKVIDQGVVDTRTLRIELNTGIKTNKNYSLELYKADGTLCVSRDICHLIADDFRGRDMNEHKCLNKKRPCHLEIDLEELCDNTHPVIVTVNEPSRFAYLSMKGIENKTLNFYENETFSLTCYQNESSNLTWYQHFPIDSLFYDNESLLKNTKYMFKITLRWFDNGTTAYCTGNDDAKSTKITFKLNETLTDLKDTNKIIYNERSPITRNCSEDYVLVGRNSNGNFVSYGKGIAEIYRENDNGSIIFCMHYRKIYLTDRLPMVFRVTREIDREMMYIYMDDHETGTLDVNTWLIPVVVAVVVIFGAIACVLYKRCPYKNWPSASQEPIYASINEVVYAEINTPPCTSDNPNPKGDQEPYAKIIGVLEPKRCQTDG